MNSYLTKGNGHEKDTEIDHPLRWAGLIGIVPLATGLFGYCPLYALFGFDTCPLKKA